MIKECLAVAPATEQIMAVTVQNKENSESPTKKRRKQSPQAIERLQSQVRKSSKSPKMSNGNSPERIMVQENKAKKGVPKIRY